MPETRKILVQTKRYTVFEDGSCFKEDKEPLLNIIYDLALKVKHYYNVSKKISEVSND